MDEVVPTRVEQTKPTTPIELKLADRRKVMYWELLLLTPNDDLVYFEMCFNEAIEHMEPGYRILRAIVRTPNGLIIKP